MTLEPGQLVGTTKFRTVHKDFYKGIYVPSGSDIAVSIRFRPHENEDWGYHDAWISRGHSLDYTGQGGPPGDQQWNRWNLGLLRAHETRSPVHVFEVLPEIPRRYRFWGMWYVTRWYESLDPSQQRRMFRFVVEVPD